MSEELKPCENTDRELWREREGDFYADSIHVTVDGGIGINVGGTVYVKPLREWHKLAAEKAVAAQQQQNEDTARLEWMCNHCTEEFFESLPDYLAEAREFIDAARGVQPAAKAKFKCSRCGDTKWVGGEPCPECSAQQQPAPAAEQRRKRQHLVPSAGYWFDGSRKAQDEGKHAEAVMFMENAYNHVENALAAARDAAPSPAPEKPVEASVEIDCPFCDSRTEITYASTGISIECIGDDGCHAFITLPCFPNEAAELIERALAASAPSPSKPVEAGGAK